jgi:hypothetical protein
MDDRLLLIRELTLDGVPSFVAVDVDRMRLGIARAGDVEAATRPAEGDELSDARAWRPWPRPGARPSVPSAMAVSPGKTRFALTIDMCQSSHGWDRTFFDWLVAHGPSRSGSP